jgi:hypothetical protein
MATSPKASFGVVEGHLVYVKVAQSEKKYQSEVDYEYSVGVIVDEDAADTWSEQFKKQPAKKVKVSDFESKYKFPCPIEGVKNVWEIKLKRAATTDGVPNDAKFRPKLFIDQEDGERIDATESRLCANGTFAKVSYYISDNSFGTFSRLNNILVQEDNFIEYVSSGGKAGDEFGSKPIKKEAARVEATEARPVKTTKAKVVEQEPSDSDSPF